VAGRPDDKHCPHLPPPQSSKTCGEGCCDRGGRPIKLKQLNQATLPPCCWYGGQPCRYHLLSLFEAMARHPQMPPQRENRWQWRQVTVAVDKAFPPPSLLLFLATLLSMAGEDGSGDGGGGGSCWMVTVGEEGEVEEGQQMWQRIHSLLQWCEMGERCDFLFHFSLPRKSQTDK
jgi:hypothetical protein